MLPRCSLICQWSSCSSIFWLLSVIVFISDISVALPVPLPTAPPPFYLGKKMLEYFWRIRCLSFLVSLASWLSLSSYPPPLAPLAKSACRSQDVFYSLGFVRCYFQMCGVGYCFSQCCEFLVPRHRLEPFLYPADLVGLVFLWKRCWALETIESPMKYRWVSYYSALLA